MILARIAIVVGAVLGFVACRPGEGDYCLCPGECRGGLVCAQGGAVLDSCISAAPGQDAGRCIEQDGLADMVDSAEATAAPEYHDVGGKRDFEPGTPSDDGITEGSTTAGPSTTSGSSSSSGGAASTDTGGSSSGGATSTGSTGT